MKDRKSVSERVHPRVREKERERERESHSAGDVRASVLCGTNLFVRFAAQEVNRRVRVRLLTTTRLYTETNAPAITYTHAHTHAHICHIYMYTCVLYVWHTRASGACEKRDRSWSLFQLSVSCLPSPGYPSHVSQPKIHHAYRLIHHLSPADAFIPTRPMRSWPMRRVCGADIQTDPETCSMIGHDSCLPRRTESHPCGDCMWQSISPTPVHMSTILVRWRTKTKTKKKKKKKKKKKEKTPTKKKKKKKKNTSR